MFRFTLFLWNKYSRNEITAWNRSLVKIIWISPFSVSTLSVTSFRLFRNDPLKLFTVLKFYSTVKINWTFPKRICAVNLILFNSSIKILLDFSRIFSALFCFFCTFSWTFKLYFRCSSSYINNEQLFYIFVHNFISVSSVTQFDSKREINVSVEILVIK